MLFIEKLNFYVYDTCCFAKIKKTIILQSRLGDLEEGRMRDDYGNIVGLLGSGAHPNLQQIESITDLFAENQLLGMAAIWADHKNALVRLHGMHMGWRRRKRLRDRAMILREMDFVMAEEGVTCMSHEELKTVCSLLTLIMQNFTNLYFFRRALLED